MSGANGVTLASFPPLPLFDGLSQDSLAEVSRLGELTDLEPDQILFREGDLGDRLYLILHGRLEVASRADREIFYFRPGDMVGEIALLDGLPRTATVTAIESSRLFAISRERFKEFLAIDATLAFNMISLINRKMRSALEREKALNTNLRAKIASVTQLAAGVAHELNTPLSAITMGNEMALSVLRSKPERAEKSLKTALKAAETADSIISKLKYYSRETKMVTHTVALAQLVYDTLRRCNYQADGMEIRTSLDGEVMVQGDPQELQQVLTQLLDNARDAILEGDHPKVIEVAVRREGSNALVLVTDQGAGLAPDHLSRVFEPFFTTKPIGSGTGLGLSVSERIMEVHEGSLKVSSGDGRTTFVMVLPAQG